jgi:hypothetical protein
MVMNWELALVYLALSLAVAQTENERFIELTLAGGSHAGHYEVQDSDGCIYDHSWDITYSLYLDKPSGNSPETFGLLMLNVPDGNDPSRFTLVAGFGDYGTPDYSEYFLEGANGVGTGLVQIEKAGKHALITVTGETSDGVALTATFECLDVLDLTGETLRTNELALSFPPDHATPKGSLELTVGGESYRVQTGDEATCDRGVAETSDLWYDYDPGGSYTGLLLVIQDLEEAKAGTANFGFSIDMHPYHAYGDGGNLTVTQDGNSLTIQAEFTSTEGTAVAATVTCPLTN